MYIKFDALIYRHIGLCWLSTVHGSSVQELCQPLPLPDGLQQQVEGGSEVIMKYLQTFNMCVSELSNGIIQIPVRTRKTIETSLYHKTCFEFCQSPWNKVPKNDISLELRLCSSWKFYRTQVPDVNGIHPIARVHTGSIALVHWVCPDHVVMCSQCTRAVVIGLSL